MEKVKSNAKNVGKASKPVDNAINIRTSPITDAGIGIGIKLSIIFEINNIIPMTNTWCKNE